MNIRDNLLPDYVGVFSQAGAGKGRNGDRYRILTRKAPLVQKAGRGEIFAVFDGIGSKQFGPEAAQAMCDCLVDFYKKPDRYDCSAEGLREVLLAGNYIIDNWGNYPGSGMHLGGCAGTVLWIYEQRLFLFQAGDTSGLLIKDNEIHQVTKKDNAPDGSLTRFFGQGGKLVIDVFEADLLDYSYILLISDGVSSRLDNEDLAGIVRGKPALAGAKDIVQQAILQGSIDDATVLAIDVVEIN